MNRLGTFGPLRRRTVEKALRSRVAGEVRCDRLSRLLYSTDASIYQIEPLGVVIPKTVEDVVAAMEVAYDLDVPVLPRGAGTSLSGQAIGPALILDFSKYLNRILEFDAGRMTVRVQPGVVLDELNRFLAPYGLEFGPDVATSNRANIGGMIGNNSAGVRSLVYGKTVDHVVEVSGFLGDGTWVRWGPLSTREWSQCAQAPGREGEVYRTVEEVVREHADEIRKRYPKILRRVSGYNLDEVLRSWDIARGTPPEETYPYPLPRRAPLPDPKQPWNLARLIVGSEGTLMVVTEAVLRVSRRPGGRALVLLEFDDLLRALEAVAPLLETSPSAIELLDRMVLDLARRNLEASRYREVLPGDPEAVLIVEYEGEDPSQAQEAAWKLQDGAARFHGLLLAQAALKPSEQHALWSLRKTGVGLLYNVPGRRKPVGFVEDTAVGPDRLPEFVRRFRDILERYGTTGSFYGHASVGCLHIRPLLDLTDPGDRDTFKRIADEVAELVLEFEGALSGEHGDGLARSAYNGRLFGAALYAAFRRLKRAFDPKGLLNPGKIVDAPPPDQNLRVAASALPVLPATVFRFRDQEGLGGAVDACMGAGACRKLRAGTMCPSYRVTFEETHTTRGRANALRAALSGLLSPLGLADPRLEEALDLCLMCKGCKAECPANVDLARLKAEFLHHYYHHRRRPLSDYFVAHLRLVTHTASYLPWLWNRLARFAPMRTLLEWGLGVDRRRPLPALASESFDRWFRHRKAPTNGRSRTVLVLDDCFTTYHEPQVLKALVELAEAAGYRVQLAGIPCCGRTLISKGFLNQFRALARTNVRHLSHQLRKAEALVGVEPSCLLTLVDEYTDLGLGRRAEEVSQRCHLADAWLAQRLREAQVPLRPYRSTVLVHAHCHQKALVGTAPTLELLRLIPDLDVRDLETGCCGMAGFFGYEQPHYELSVAIARSDLLKKASSEPQGQLVATGFSCRSQVLDLTGKRPWHPVEVVRHQLQTWPAS
jgi:FAD/FMN-containing dehydrogenase/Fe-S oxidoreductase